MQTLFIGFVEDSVDPIMEGLAIRIAYLFSSQLRLSGNVSDYFIMIEGLRYASLEQKIKYIDDRRKDEPGYNLFYDGYKKFKKAYKKDRGKNKELLVMQKQTEIKVNDLYNYMIDDLAKTLKVAGLLDLKPVTDNSLYGDYYIPYLEPESGKNGYSRLSDIFQLKLDEDDNENATLFILSNLFLSPEFDQGNEAIPELNTFSDKGFMQELFMMPHYNYFSFADLNTIRFEANKSIESFQQCVKTFATMAADPAAAFNYLQNNVLAVAKILADDLNKIGVVANYISLVPHAATVNKLYLGLIPRSLVFKYFEFTKASREETVAILDQLPDEEKNQLVPVLVIDRIIPEEIADMAEVKAMPLKKSLSID